jgi:hypothetical protein
MSSIQIRSYNQMRFPGKFIQTGCGLLWLAFLVAAMPAFSQATNLRSTNLVSENYQKEWTRVGFPPDFKVSQVAQWHVDPAKGEIVCDGNGGHDWFRFNKEYSNFAFHAEWRFTKVKGNPHYNSGVFFRNSENGTTWHQAQTTPEGGYVFGETPVNGKLTAFNEQKNMTENRVKPAGQWNTYDIRCLGATCTLAVNGKVVNTIQVGVDKGYLGLESEGFQITFRNLKVQELP